MKIEIFQKNRSTTHYEILKLISRWNMAFQIDVLPF